MKRPDLPVRKIIIPCLLFLLALSIHLFAANPERVENIYATGIYPVIAAILRNITGWIPFSIGDILYFVFIVYILSKLVSFIRGRKWKQKAWGKSLILNFISTTLYIYLIFNILWGLNYNRKGISHQMDFERPEYTKEELLMVNDLLAAELNSASEALADGNMTIPGKRELLRAAEHLYMDAEKHYPFLKYDIPSVKSSLIGWLGNYWGFSGYYNPFTGEAQVNTDMPAFTQPFIALHEIAHQLGYAKENEANFVGYMTAVTSDNDIFRYSACFDLFLYANRNLRRVDSSAAKAVMETLYPAVKEDMEELKRYYKKYENPVEPLIRWVYGKYLQVNAQPEGMMSYSEVVADLIGYYKKYGTIVPARRIP